MIKFSEKNKGAISVFLVCILLPVMLFSSILIDQSRIRLAKARVAQATDITLNTALANYDNIMKEMYGIFATSQTTDDMLDKVEDYYTRNLKIAGLDTETAELFSDGIINSITGYFTDDALDDMDYADFLKVFTDDFYTNIDLNNGENYKNGPTLSNPGIMKEQIVDFMKFRAPLGIGLDLINVIKSFNTIEEQSKVIEDKTNYYNAQSKFEEYLSKAWGNLELYRKLTNGELIKSGDERYKSYYDLKSKGGALEKLEKLTSSSSEDKTENLTGKMRVILDSLTFEQIMAVPQKDNSQYEYQENGNAETQTYDYYYKLPYNFEKEKKDGKEWYTYSKYGNSQSFSFDGREHTSDEELTDEEVAEKETAFNKVYDRLTVCEENLLNAVTSSPKSSEKSLCDVAESSEYDHSVAYVSYINYLNIMTNWGERYWEYCDALREYTEKWYDLPKSVSEDQEYSSKIPGLKKDKFLHDSVTGYETIRKVLDMYSTAYDKGFEYGGAHRFVYKEIYPLFKGVEEALTDGKKYLTNAETELQNAIDYYNNELKKAKDEWSKDSNAAKIQGSDFSESNNQEIKIINDKFNLQDIEDLKKAIGEKNDTMDILINEVDQFSFGGEKLYELADLKSYYEVAQQILSEDGDIIRIYKDNDFENLKYRNLLDAEAKDDGKFEYNNNITDTGKKTKAQVLNLEFGTELLKQLPLYVYMSSMYKGASASIEGNASGESSDDTQKESMKDKMNSMEKPPLEESAESGKKYVSPDVSIDDSFPSRAANGTDAGSDSGLKNESNLGRSSGGADWDSNSNAMNGAGETANNIFGEILGVIEKGLEGLRNDLYLEEYIMGMFSYRTLEKETFVAQYEDAVTGSYSKESVYVNFSLYEQKDDQNSFSLSENCGISSNIDGFNPTEIINKLETLTNVPINPENNAYYLKEVEYIIYGDNGAGAENTIYVIRFLTNVIAAFMNSELTAMARSIAMLCFGYPPLTFLVPIAQVLILIALAIGETAIDMHLIIGGFSVPLIKTENTWMLSPKGLLNEVKATAVEIAENIVEDTVSKAADWFNNTFSDMADNLSDYSADEIDKLKSDMSATLENAYDEKIGTYVSDVTDLLLDVCNQYIDMAYLNVEYYDAGDGNGKAIAYEAEADKVCNTLKDLADPEKLADRGIEYEIKKKTLSIIVDNKSTVIVPLLECFDKTRNKESVGINDAVQTIPTKIKEAVLGTTSTALNVASDFTKDKIENFKQIAVNKVTGMVDQGKDKVLEASQDFFGGLSDKAEFGTEGINNELTSDKGKTLSLSYSGYLRLFLLIALIANQENVISRMGDIMQANLRKVTNKPDYTLSKSYAVVSINVNSRINPLFFGFDSIAELVNESRQKNSAGDKPFDEKKISDLYGFSYSQMAGY